jgi:hypothetical protein
MQSTAKPKPIDDPHDFVVVPSDQVRVAPPDVEITDLLRAAARPRSESGPTAASNPSGSTGMPAVDTTFRATAVNNDVLPAFARSSFGWRLMRALIALVLAMGIGGAAVGWQLFGNAAKRAVGRWLPQMALTTSFSLDKIGFGTSSQPAEPVAAETSAQTIPPAPARAASDSAAVNAAASPSDSAQLLQSMARDLANLGQQVETLKASVVELKASQQQMMRDRAAEQNTKAKLSAAPSHPPAAARKPVPAYSPTPAPLAPPPVHSSSQAASAPALSPYVPQAGQPGLASVPRPPMPVQ